VPSWAAAAAPDADLPTTTQVVEAQATARGSATVAAPELSAKVAPPSTLVSRLLAPAWLVATTAKQLEASSQAAPRTERAAGWLGSVAGVQLAPPSWVTSSSAAPEVDAALARQSEGELQLSRSTVATELGSVPPVVQVLPASRLLAAQTCVASALMARHQRSPAQATL